MNKDDIAKFLQDMIDTLTFRRVALLCLLSSILIVVYTVFENRAAVFATIYRNSNTSTAIEWTLSNESKAELTNLTKTGLVGAVLLSDVDLKKNRKTIKYTYIVDKSLATAAAPILSTLLPQALFDYDSKNTDQMVAMLNNEFICSQTKDTSYVRFLPDLPRKLPVICRIAVPPFFGEFAGFISIGLNRQPTPSEFDALKIEMNRTAIELYLRDISKNPPSF
jgi:hypothetical protein